MSTHPPKDGFLRGDFRSLPPLQTNLIRIFTSSTFTDMLAERNYLIQKVYPHLREYCQQLGMEFEVVDMRWGVNDDMSADHMTTKLCLREIVNCQRLSQGPNFVALLGDKYGFRPIPNEIVQTEFDMLLNFIDAKKDKELLCKWFWQDTNQKPPCYILQPITVHYHHYNNMKDSEARQFDRGRWWEDFSNLRGILKNAAKLAALAGCLKPEEEEKYNISVTESEVKEGIMKVKSPEHSCLCFVRVFTELDDAVAADDVIPYIDIDERGVKDNEGKERSKILRFDKIKKALNNINLNCFKVRWKRGGINEQVDEHRRYLENLGHSYIEQVKELIKKQEVTGSNEHELSTEDGFQKEALSHAWFCFSKCKTFCGRENELNSIKRALIEKQRRLIVLHGRSGCGKTALMAKVTERLQSWYDGDIDVMVRFLGTTPGSSDVNRLLQSLVQQLCHIYDIKLPPNEILADFNRLLHEFFALLQRVNVVSNKPLAIVLDSLDQLSASHGSYSLRWLPRNMPSNVLLVLSTIAEYDDLLETINLRYGEVAHYVEVKPLSLETAESILQHYFTLVKRTVTSNQHNSLLSKLTKSSEPLLLKLLFDESCHWRSYDEIPLSRLGDDVLSAISLLFERLERLFGQVLISHAFGYIAASKSGLSEAEIEDILSLDNAVLDQVYTYWDPPLEGVIRLPPLLWKRIRYEMEEYLVERQADGVTVLNWYHRQFIQESKRRYLENDNSKEKRSQAIADYFLGTYANDTPKPIMLTRRGKDLLMVSRKVASQPLSFAENRYNYRKLSELPLALLQAGNYSVLCEQVLFNFDWILTKIKATSVHETLMDYELTLKIYDEKELRQLFLCLKLSSSNLQQDPESLGSQLLGRLSYVFMYETFPNTARLLSRAKVWCSSQHRPVLMPRRTCMTTPGGFLVTTFKGHVGRLQYVEFLKNQEEFISVSRNGEKVQVCLWVIETMAQKAVFDLRTTNDPLTSVSKCEDFAIVALSGKIVKISLQNEDISAELECRSEPVCMQIDPHGRLFCVSYSSGALVVYTIDDFSVVFETEFSSPSTAISLDDDSFITVGFKDGQTKVLDLKNKACVTQGPTMDGALHSVWSLPSSRNMVMVSVNGQVMVLEKTALRIISNQPAQGCHVCSSYLAKDRVILGCKDGYIRAVAFAMGADNPKLKVHDKEVWCLSAAAKVPKILVTGSKDDTLCIIDYQRMLLLHRYVGHSSWISCVVINREGNFVLSGSNDKNVKLWKRTENADEVFDVSQELFPHARHPRCMKMTNDSLFAISGSVDSCLIWDLTSAQLAHRLMIDAAYIEIGHTGSLFITGASSGEIMVHSLPLCTQLSTCKSQNSGVAALKLLGDDKFCVAGFENGVLDIFDVNTGDNVGTVQAHENTSSLELCTRTSPVYLVSAGKDKLTNIWAVNPMSSDQPFSLLHTVNDHPSYVLCISFVQDGRYFLTGARDGTVRFIEIETGDVIRTFEASRQHDSVVCILPYGSNHILGIHGPKNNLISWHPWRNEIELEYVGHSHAVMCLMLSTDDKYLISGSRDGTLKAWDASGGMLLDSIDLQSQIKYGVISPRTETLYRIAATAMSGSILVVEFYPNDTMTELVKQEELEPEKPARSQSAVRIGSPSHSYEPPSRNAQALHLVHDSRCCSLF